MDEIQRTKILQRLANSEYLPSPSPVLMQLIELASDDSASPSDLARIIETDPGLTTRIIKLANSAFYVRSRKITTVAQAILMLGFKRLRITALSISLRDSFPFGRVGSMDYEYFWKTSLYRAIIAQGFSEAAATHSFKDEEVFTAALILEIGLLMLYQICPDELKEAFPCNASLEELIDWEESSFGIHHRQVSRVVLSRWRFTDQVIESQKHYGKAALRRERSDFCRIIEIARSGTEALFGGKSDFGFIQRAASLLNITPAKIHEILDSSFSRVEEMAESLRLKACSEEDKLFVIERANRALAGINNSLQVNLGRIIGLVSRSEELDAECAAENASETRKAVSNVLDAVVHEIRNPLMAIGGFAQRMVKNPDARDSLVKYADIIVNESLRLQQALNELIALSQAYAPSRAEGDLRTTLDEAIDGLRTVFDRKHIEIKRNYEREAFIVYADQEAIKRAISHILEALLELMSDNFAELRVELPDEETPDSVKIVIYIQGSALPDFEKKALMGSGFSSKTFGPGIGILKAWRILEAHKGRIEIQTEADAHRLIIHLPRRFESSLA